ncbi:hypothetical protein GCM10010387_61570 [Streptomyces inusitatus]|uniref:Integral membrane protein n=1 Tax=Streptomyces inusitatus TaxID=68221 RepID=A0A918QLX2_9ACTN|nr:DUF1109 domain-containing protein [Streptomyces inusitatus]GGZ59519.1 hypothetical protein GCM10010387_61570 [Streptomyces inusitatus]
MYDEYDTYGGAAPYPDRSGYVPWEDAYIPVPGDPMTVYQPVVPVGMEQLDATWDPNEELEQLLQTSDTHEFDLAPAHASAHVHGHVHDHGHGHESPVDLPHQGPPGPAAVPLGPPPPHRRRRRQPARSPRVVLMRVVSFLIAAVAAVIVSMVSALGVMIALDPLRSIADPRISQGLVSWWPLLVYGPWTVASLSILRASLHRRRAVHSWSVVLAFSLLATLLCVAQAPRTFTDAAAAALPSLAALACFQQLVRLITMLRPPRQAAARHRHRTPPPPPPAEHRQPSDQRPPTEPPGKAPLAPPVEQDAAVPRGRPPVDGVFPRPQPLRRGGFH